MFGRLTSPAGLAQVIQVALTPGLFSDAVVSALLNVFSTRLGRVADHVDRLTDELQNADTAQSAIAIAQLTYPARADRDFFGFCRRARDACGNCDSVALHSP